MLLHGLVSLLAAGTLTAQDWVRTTEGAVPMGATARLQVRTRGSVVVRGSAGDQVTYKLVERAKSRRPLRDVITSTRVMGDLTRLVVAPAPASRAIAQLEVNIPRQVMA